MVDALKEYIRGLTIKFVQLKSSFDKQEKMIGNLKSKIAYADKIVAEKTIGYEKYNMLEKIWGGKRR